MVVGLQALGFGGGGGRVESGYPSVSDWLACSLIFIQQPGRGWALGTEWQCQVHGPSPPLFKRPFPPNHYPLTHCCCSPPCRPPPILSYPPNCSPPSQVTVFPACLALDARRETRMRAGKGGCGCALPGPCVKDDYKAEVEGGLDGWTPETEVLKVPLHA